MGFCVSGEDSQFYLDLSLFIYPNLFKKKIYGKLSLSVEDSQGLWKNNVYVKINYLYWNKLIWIVTNCNRF